MPVLVAHDHSLGMLDLLSYTESDVVHHFVGTEDDMQQFVGPEDHTTVISHDHERLAAQNVAD